MNNLEVSVATKTGKKKEKRQKESECAKRLLEETKKRRDKIKTSKQKTQDKKLQAESMFVRSKDNETGPRGQRNNDSDSVGAYAPAATIPPIYPDLSTCQTPKTYDFTDRNDINIIQTAQDLKHIL